MRALALGQRTSFKSQLMIGVASAAAAAASTAAYAESAAPPAEPVKWQPFVEAGAAADSDSGIGALSLFAPLKQDLDSLLFARLGVQTRFKSDNVESLQIGYRLKNGGGWIFGGYVGLDHSQTDLGTGFSQFSAGLEAMSADWDAHLNAYLADNKVVANPNGFMLDIHDTFIGIRQQQEAAFSGFDGEVGYKVFRDDGMDVRLYAGGFDFEVNDKTKFPTKSMAGERGGAELNLYDLDFIGPQSRFQIAGEVSHDDLRGTTEFVGATLRIPLGDNSGQGAQALDELDRRMVDDLHRHQGVATSAQFNKVEPVIIHGHGITSSPTNSLYYVDNTAGEGSYDDPTTLPDATGRPGPNQFIILTDRSGSNVNTFGATVKTGETLVGPDLTFTVTGANSGESFVHTFAPGSGPVTLYNPSGPVLVLDPNTNLYGMTLSGNGVDPVIYGHNINNVVIGGVTIDGNGAPQGIDIVQDAPGDGNVDIFGSSIYDVVDGIDATVTNTGGTNNFNLNFSDSSVNATGGGVFVDSSTTGGGTTNVYVGIHDDTITSGGASSFVTGTAAGGSTLNQTVVVDPTYLFGGYFGVFVNAVADDATLIQNVTIDQVTVTDTKYSGIAIHATGLNGADVTQNVTINKSSVTGSNNPIIIGAVAIYGSLVTQDVTMTDVQALDGLGTNISLYAHSYSGSTIDQTVSMDGVTANNSAQGDGIFIDSFAYGGYVNQTVDANDLTVSGNGIGVYVRGSASNVSMAGGEGVYLGQSAQYVTISNSIVGGEGGGNFRGLSAGVGTNYGGVARQDITLTNSEVTYNDYGVNFYAKAFRQGSTQQDVVLYGDTIRDNALGSAAEFMAVAELDGFTTQNAYIAYTDLSHAAGAGVTVSGIALSGGNTEQNFTLYEDNLSYSGTDNLQIYAAATGYQYPTNAEGYAYYSHAAQLFLIGYSNLSHAQGIGGEGGSGIHVDAFAVGYSQINQYAYVYGSDLSHNARDGVYSHVLAANGASLYSNTGVYFSDLSHNAANGFENVSYDYGANYAFGSYMIQHLTVVGSDLSNNSSRGFTDLAYAGGIYSFNDHYITLANSNFDNNGSDGAYFAAEQNYGYASFGAAIQNVTITDSTFNENDGNGLGAYAGAQGVQGRAEQHFTVLYSEFDDNAGDGIHLDRVAGGGDYRNDLPCYAVQGLYGGCAFVRQTFIGYGIDASDNGGNGISINSSADNYGALYAKSGRPVYPTFYLGASTVNDNGGDGLRINNTVTNGSYEYQYVLAYNTHFDDNAGYGVYSQSYVGATSTLLQGIILASGGEGVSSASGNGLGGIVINAQTTYGLIGSLAGLYGALIDDNDGSGLVVASSATGGTVLQQVNVVGSSISGNGVEGSGNGVSVSGTADYNDSYASTVSQYVNVVGSDISNNGGYGMRIAARSTGPASIAQQQVYVGYSSITGNGDDGIHAFEIAYGQSAANQILNFSSDEITDNQGNGIYAVGIAVSGSFTTQNLTFAYDAPYVSDITGNGGDGIYVGAAAFSGAAAEQNLFAYNVNASGNTGDGLGIGSGANGYGFGYYLYYSHVSQNVIAALDTFDNNGGEGIHVSNNAYYGGAMNQFLYFGGDDVSNNTGAGFYETSSLTSIRGNSFSFSTNQNTSLYLNGSTFDNNGAAGIDIRSYANGAVYAPAFFGGYNYQQQHTQIVGSEVKYNGGSGLSMNTSTVGRYSLNAEYVTISGSTFDRNSAAGAVFVSNDYYGPGSFGVSLQQITISGSTFSYNTTDGLQLAANSSGRQGRAEQHVTISGSTLDDNGGDGLSISASAVNGVYLAGHPCTTVQGLPGGCAFVRQNVTVVGSDISDNTGNGVSDTNYANNYGAIYAVSGRPHYDPVNHTYGVPTLELFGVTVNDNGARGLDIGNRASGNSYLYQYVAAIDSTFDRNDSDGVYGASYVGGASTMLQRAVLYSYNTTASASYNGINSSGIKMTIEALGGSYARDFNIVLGLDLLHNGGFGFDGAVAYADAGSLGVQINNVAFNAVNYNNDGVGLYSFGPGALSFSYIAYNTITHNAFVGVYGEANFGAFQYIGVYTFGNTVNSNGTDYLFNAFGGSTQNLN